MKRLFLDILRLSRRHDVMNLAANISFFAILSLFPMMMIFVSVLAHVMGTEATVVQRIAESLTDMIPGAKDIFITNIENIISKKTTLGWGGLAFLLLISTVLISSLERALDTIFESERSRHFLKSRLVAVGVIIVIALILFLPSAIRLLESVITKYGVSLPFASYFSGKAFFAIFAIISFLLVVTIVPHKKVFARYALVGALIFALGVGVAKYLFQWYLFVSFNRYNIVYGSLSAIILTIIWIYYLSIILLVSTEVVAYIQKRMRDRKRSGI